MSRHGRPRGPFNWTAPRAGSGSARCIPLLCTKADRTDAALYAEGIVGSRALRHSRIPRIDTAAAQREESNHFKVEPLSRDWTESESLIILSGVLKDQKLGVF